MAKRFPPGFSWDWAKWREVKLARGIDLNDMIKLFEGVITEDIDVGLNPKTGKPEERRRAVGFVGSKIYRVVYKFEGDRRHLITAFEAGQQEANDYLNLSFGEPEFDQEWPWQVRRRHLSGKRTPKKVRRRRSARRWLDPTNESDQ